MFFLQNRVKAAKHLVNMFLKTEFKDHVMEMDSLFCSYIQLANWNLDHKAEHKKSRVRYVSFLIF